MSALGERTMAALRALTLSMPYDAAVIVVAAQLEGGELRIVTAGSGAHGKDMPDRVAAELLAEAVEQLAGPVT